MAAARPGSQQRVYKVVLLGEGKVGKTSLLLRFTQDSFNEAHNQTVQACFTNKRLTIDGTSITLSIWDTAGQERFHALGAVYYRDASCAILVYDITDRESFERVQAWVKELKRLGREDVVLVLAGNKADLERTRVISQVEGDNYATSVHAKHFVTSAKLNKNVRELFYYVGQMMLTKPSDRADESSWGTVNLGATQQSSGGGCC